jgi:hypothetical protein
MCQRHGSGKFARMQWNISYKTGGFHGKSSIWNWMFSLGKSSINAGFNGNNIYKRWISWGHFKETQFVNVGQCLTIWWYHKSKRESHYGATTFWDVPGPSNIKWEYQIYQILNTQYELRDIASWYCLKHCKVEILGLSDSPHSWKFTCKPFKDGFVIRWFTTILPISNCQVHIVCLIYHFVCLFPCAQKLLRPVIQAAGWDMPNQNI